MGRCTGTFRNGRKPLTIADRTPDRVGLGRDDKVAEDSNAPVESSIGALCVRGERFGYW